MKPRRFDWYPADWLDGVGGMPPDQRGVYDTIINLIYARASEDGSIEMDENELAHRCFCHWRELRRILVALVRGGKVSQEGRKITITRCAEEVQKACRRVAKAQQNGAKGGRPNNLEEPDGFEKSRLTRGTTSNQHTSDNNQQTESPPLSPSLESPPEPKPVKPKHPKTLVTLPDDWALKESHKKLTISLGHNMEWLFLECDQFKDKNIAKNGRYSNWDLAFNTWIRNAHKFDNQRPSFNGGVKHFNGIMPQHPGAGG